MTSNFINYPDIGALLIKIQERLASLENKVDTIVDRISPTKVVEAKPFSAPVHPRVQQPMHANLQSPGRQDNRGRERVMHKIICAECKKESEIPFRPSGGRPVYCKECFARRKAGSSFKPSIDTKPQETALAQTIHIDQRQAGEKEKPVEKQEPVERKASAAKKKSDAKKKPVIKKRQVPRKQKKKGSR